MRYAIIYSKENIAGTNIVNQFKKLSFSPQTPIIEKKKQIIYTDIYRKDYPELKNIDFLVFASTHRSKDNQPALTIHTPGNPRSADLGGKPNTICPSSTNIMKYLFQKLKDKSSNLTKYAITMEATHHGPDTDIPCCFIELGATETEWKDEKAAKILAETILELDNYQPDNSIPTIAIGGPHYTPNFNKIQLNSKYSIAHIIPKYSLPLTPAILKEAEKKTKEQVKTLILDWKGLGNKDEKAITLKTIEQAGLSYIKTSDIKK